MTRHHAAVSVAHLSRSQYGHRWYDAKTGRIDRIALAAQAMRHAGEPDVELTELPTWAESLPEHMPPETTTVVMLAQVSGNAGALFRAR